jgi:hypothetical protein
MRIPLFRIWYSTTYTTILLLLLLILAVTPADTIYQSVRSDELQKLFVIGGVYLLTFLIVILIYSTRVYTNRTVLSAIPKPYVPVEEGEIGKSVRRLIAKELRRRPGKPGHGEAKYCGNPEGEREGKGTQETETKEG